MTWDRRLYFPSEGRRAEDFFTLKNPMASARFEPANLGTKGQLYPFNKTVLKHIFFEKFIWKYCKEKNEKEWNMQHSFDSMCTNARSIALLY